MAELISVLNTNYVPTERECESIKQYLATPEKFLGDLGDQILQHEVFSQHMRDQRNELRNIIDLYRALLSPFRRMPNDILREIFVLCLSHKHNATMSPRDPPVSLTHVCHRWRQVAHTTPRLWSSLHLYTYTRDRYRGGEPTPEGRLRRDARVREWLDRAGILPLSLSFCPTPGRAGTVLPDPNSADVRRLLSLLSAGRERRDMLHTSIAMEYIGDNDPGLETHSTVDLIPLRHVRKLSLRLRLFKASAPTPFSCPRAVDEFLKSLDLKSSTHLRELSLCFNVHPYTPLSFTQFIPCSQLEVLNLQDPRDSFRFPTYITKPDDVPLILRQCPNLIVFKVNVGFGDQALKGHHEKVVMTELRRLSLSISLLVHLVHIAPVFHCLVVPKLSFFHLRGWCRPGKLPPPPLWTFLDRVGSQLTSLTLDSLVPIVTLLPMLPSLVQLYLEASHISMPVDESDGDSSDSQIAAQSINAEVIGRLTPSRNGAIPLLCPNLQYLRWEDQTHFSDNSLLRLLVERATSTAPLKQVQIFFGRPREYDILPECAGLVNNGLGLRLVYHDRPRSLEDQYQLVPTVALPIWANDLTLGWD